MAKTWTKSGHRDRRLKQSTYDRRHGQNVSGDFWGMLFCRPSNYLMLNYSNYMMLKSVV